MIYSPVMGQTLSELLDEPIEAVKCRARNALDDVLASRAGKVVLFGSGNLGRQAAKLLRGIGIEPLAFTDNNPDRWGTEVEGLPVLEPAEAARRYGSDSTLLVTIWNEFHWFSETQQKMSDLGCSQIAPYTWLHWRFPEALLPCLLNDRPHLVYEDKLRVLAASTIWADEQSAQLYVTNVRLRALGQLGDLPGRPAENTYFPMDILALTETEHFLDCGATRGEMTQDVLLKFGDSFATFHALEADQISFERLAGYHRQLSEPIRTKVILYNLAVGAKRGIVHFTSTGGTGSKISDVGVKVECVPIDELFENKPLTFLKMDIEGAEFDSLLGARKVIERDRPVLAICLYHTQNDLWRIPLLVREMLPEHQLFLRAYEGDGFQTVLFAVPTHKVRAQAAGPRNV